MPERDALQPCLLHALAEAAYFRALFKELAERTEWWEVVRQVEEGKPVVYVAPRVQRALYEAFRDRDLGTEMLRFLAEQEERVRELQAEVDRLNGLVARPGCIEVES